MVRTWRQSSLPALLSPEEVERVLASTDRSTSRGRRDYAILLLLARLGLRAGEIVSLELGDLRWRSGEIVVHGKGGWWNICRCCPMIGEALAGYLREARGASASRRVFLRMLAPRVGLAGPARLTISYAWPSCVPGYTRQAVALRTCSGTAWPPE
jgi:integrase/recombinase XerD